MAWFRADDGLPFHRKVLRAGNEAMGAWVRAGAWSSSPSNLTDGWIPAEVCEQIAPPRVWAKLRAVGLTEAPSDGRDGEQLHDFLEYNPSASSVRADREKWARTKRISRGKTKSVIFSRDGYRCRYCGSADDLTIDHIIPRIQCGSDDEDNLATCCGFCNSKKCGRTPDEAGMTLRPLEEAGE